MSDPYHCVVSWDVYTNDADAASETETQLKAVIAKRSWVRPMSTPFFIVKLRTPLDRRTLKNDLVEVARKHPKTVRLVVGPAVIGSYGGWLPKTTWEKIRMRTQADGSE